LTTLVQPEPIRTMAPRAANAVGPSAILTAVTATASHHQPIKFTATTDYGEVETSELGAGLELTRESSGPGMAPEL